MGKVTWKPGTMLYPLPVAMVSCGTMERANIITVCWTGIINSEPPMTYISVRPERFSYNIIRESGEFVINLTTKELMRTADLCGVKSGRDFDKFALKGVTAAPASKTSAPIIYESPINIECTVEKIIPLGSHDMFISKIVAVNVSDLLLDKRGAMHLDRAALAVSVHGKYFSIGEYIGKFGYSVKKDRR